MSKNLELSAREIFWIQGEHLECVNLARKLLEFLQKNSATNSNFQVQKNILWFNNLAFEPQAPLAFLQTQQKTDWRLTSNRNLKNFLGTNQDLVVFDSFGGFDPNSLLLLTGALQKGGSLLLLTPKKWGETTDLDYEKIASFPYKYQDLSSFFLQHLNKNLQNVQTNKIASEADLTFLVKKIRQKNTLSASEDFKFSDLQKKTMTFLQHNWKVEKQRILISGIRGSGKTTCVAKSLADFFQNWHESKNSEKEKNQNLKYLTERPSNSALKKIVLIADNKKIAENFFTKLEKYLKELKIKLEKNSSKLRLETEDFEIEFFAPDAKLPEKPYVLIVEEAANFNASSIKNWLKKYSNSVFITTQDGYEGSNNAFKINIQQKFYEKIFLHKSFRFDQKDAIKQWLDKSFFIQDEKTHQAPVSFLTKKLSEKVSLNLDINLKFEILSSHYLLKNQRDFAQCYSLLASAHYRTRPSDLRQILDAPNSFVLGVFWQEKIIAVAFCIFEGELHKLTKNLLEGENLVEQIVAGKRRVKGHLIAQSLALNFKNAEFAKFRYLRISRIAVKTEFRRKKIATKILQYLEKNYKNQLDALATSFADKAENTIFWQKNSFMLLRKGTKIEKTSGLNSNQMLKPLDKNISDFFELIVKKASKS